MLGGKNNKPRPIAEKYSLDYYRRALATRAWKSRWNYAALVAAVALVGGVYLFQRNAAFYAAPVSSAHSAFGQNCTACHDASWQTARRLVMFDDSAHSVSDKACRECHQVVADHAAGLVPAAGCAACHQEHRPERELDVVMDRHCIECHSQLDLHTDATVNFAATIEQFEPGDSDAEHPEFAVLRLSEDGIGPRHLARTVATFVAGEAGGGKWRDRSGLKFNHLMHLDPQGVMGPDRKKQMLTCGDCHVPEADGQNMRPIVYEQHCARCHPLRLSGSLSQLGDIPHGGVAEVRGFLRESLSQLRHDSLENAPSTSTPRLPTLPTPALLSQDDQQKIDTLMQSADHAVFGPEAKGMCRHCHHLEARDGQWQVLIESPLVMDDPKVAAAASDLQMVPDRWLQHATFNHQSHRAIECGECHAAATSSETANILMPSIAVCQSCHGNAAASTSRVRADCVLCHDFHDDSQHSHGVPLRQLFTQLQPEFTPLTTQSSP